MQMLLTTLGFFLLTAVFVWRHLQGSGGGGAGPSPATPPGRPCARCTTPVPAGAQFCPGCGIPQQVFEVVSAGIATAPERTGGAVARALVRADLCVGCATCVASCPEPGALGMRGKLAVVDDALCQGHGECVAACPVGAIAVTTGTAVNRVQVPWLDAHFQTNVPGLYIVGELGGRGLIKNAINEGKIAVEHVAASLGPAGDGAAGDVAGDVGVLDVLVVGSGPAGLSAGLEAHRRHLRYAVLEQGTLGDTVRKYPRHKLLLAEPVAIPLYGDLWIADASKETLLQVWETIVANTGLQVRTGAKVEHVVRDGAHFRVDAGDGTYHARRVVLAMGRRGTPRRLGVPGEELDKVFYDIVEMEAFAGRRVLVVGGGDSAIESALGLANQPGTEVQLSYRGEGFARVKPRNQDKVAAAIAAGRVTPLFRSTVREIRPDVVVLETADGTRLVPNDHVIVRVGGEAPHAFLERLGVRIVAKDLPVGGAARAG